MLALRYLELKTHTFIGAGERGYPQTHLLRKRGKLGVSLLLRNHLPVPNRFLAPELETLIASHYDPCKEQELLDSIPGADCML